MKLKWITNGFITKELYAPFTIDTDDEYYDDLKERFSILLSQAENSGADEESIRIIVR